MSNEIIKSKTWWCEQSVNCAISEWTFAKMKIKIINSLNTHFFFAMRRHDSRVKGLQMPISLSKLNLLLPGAWCFNWFHFADVRRWLVTALSVWDIFEWALTFDFVVVVTWVRERKGHLKMAMKTRVKLCVYFITTLYWLFNYWQIEWLLLRFNESFMRKLKIFIANLWEWNWMLMNLRKIPTKFDYFHSEITHHS